MITTWITQHWLEVFGALAGILFVILEIRQNIWLWPVGIVTSAVYIVVFFTSKFYADMSLQFYYVAVSIYGWYVWSTGREGGSSGGAKPQLPVTRTPTRIILILIPLYLLLHSSMWYILANFTDSTVAPWDSLTTALSVIATWMLARKYIEHWFIWIFVNIVSMILYIYKGLYPTTILFAIYTIMSFIGYRVWRRDMITAN